MFEIVFISNGKMSEGGFILLKELLTVAVVGGDEWLIFHTCGFGVDKVCLFYCSSRVTVFTLYTIITSNTIISS